MGNNLLVERLKFWRAERPDEWAMDEFIWDAKKLEQERNELAAQNERLRKLIMDKTAQPVCCNRPYEDHETGPICCGSPDFTWPDDVVAVLSETPPAALTALKAQWQAEIISELKIHMTKNGYRDEADGVGAWFKERQITQEVGDE